MKSNRNCNSKRLVHSLNHGCNCLETCHILTSTLRYTKDYRSIHLLCSKENRLSPFKVIDVELSDSIFAGKSFV